MKKALFTLITLLLLTIGSMGAFSYSDGFEAGFEPVSFSELHLYLPLTPERDFHRLDPFPFKGRELGERIKRAFTARVNRDLKMVAFSGDERLYPLYNFAITPDVTGYIVRVGGESSFFESSIELLIYNKKRSAFTAKVALAGYSHGESGGHFYQSWILDTNGDGCLDIVTRERTGDWEELLSPVNDSLIVLSWQKSGYIRKRPLNYEEALQSFTFYRNPFYQKNALLLPTDKKAKESFIILMSSDSTLKGARFELKKYEESFTYENLKLYYLYRAPAEIVRKGERYYTLLDANLSRNEAELLLTEIKRVFPTAWLAPKSFISR